MKLLLCMIVVLACVTSRASAQELTKEQLEPWSALKRQVDLHFKQDWKEHDKYIHPKIVVWESAFPAPLRYEEGKQYFEQLAAGEDKVVAHILVPVSVVVAGDTAIINAYIHSITKPDGKSVETIYRLHNTWKKEDGRWQLLATYNTLVSPKSDDD